MLEELRRRVCAANRGLVEQGLVTGTSGNVSARDRDSGFVVIKPSGVPFADLTPASMVVLDLEGTVVDGTLLPSVDTASHLYVYRHLEAAHGIVHTHSPYATSFAVRGEPLPIYTTTSAAYFGGPVPVSDFAVIGEEEIGRQIVAHASDRPAVLIRQHGVFTLGATPEEALKYAVVLEETAQVAHLALLRGPLEPIADDVVRRGADVFRHGYGQRSSRS